MSEDPFGMVDFVSSGVSTTSVDQDVSADESVSLRDGTYL